MAKFAEIKIEDIFLDLHNPESGLYAKNHIFEPEFHQSEYTSVCKELENSKNSYQLKSCPELVGEIKRGKQPSYADDENDPSTLLWKGMTDPFGKVIDSKKTNNICALKSICIRAGYIDFETARCISQVSFEATKGRASVKKNDVLINSTGDGTIGRVAVFSQDFDAVVDGHITILRFSDANLAWFIGAFLMSDRGQKQISRYINGSSGQVEIYPQDIGRIWIPATSKARISAVAKAYREACKKYSDFQLGLKKVLSSV